MKFVKFHGYLINLANVTYVQEHNTKTYIYFNGQHGISFLGYYKEEFEKLVRENT